MATILETVSAIGALVMAATPLTAIGSVVHAEPARVSPARVAVADLDFRTAADVTVFRQRVGVAARTLCGQGGVESLTTTLSCRQAVYDEAVGKLGTAQQQDLQGASRGAALTLAAR